MARRSWLERLNPVNWLKGIIDALTPEEERPPPPPPPPPPPGGGGGGILDDEADREAAFRAIWDDTNHPRSSYIEAVEFFDSLGLYYDDLDDELNVWYAFITGMLSGDYIRNDPSNPFWSASGLTPSTGFDWDEFRRVIGYPRR